MNKILTILFLLMMVCLSDAFSEADKLRAESLRYLKSMGLVIRDLNSDIKIDGLNKECIQTDVESKLRSAGIKILSIQEWLNKLGSPHLGVWVNSSKKDESRSLYAYTIEVSLSQTVYAARNKEIVFMAETWSVEDVGFVEEENVNSIRDSVKDLVDKFINDYLSVNLK